MKKVLSIALSLVLVISCMAMAVVSASAERTPRYTVLVLDLSGSMYGSSLKSEKEAAVKFCQTATKDKSDKVAVVTFSSTAKEVCGFTNDLEELETVINGLNIQGSTNFYDALTVAKNVLDNEAGKGVSFERNIVLCSDGLPETGETLADYAYTSSDSYSYRYANAALKYDNENVKPNTNVYTIGFYTSLSTRTMEFASRFMKDLANRLSIVAGNEEELINAFGGFATEITKVETADTPDTPDVISSDSDSDSSTDTVIDSDSDTSSEKDTDSANTADSASSDSDKKNTSSTSSSSIQSSSGTAVQTSVVSPFAVMLIISVSALALAAITVKKSKKD